MNHFSPGKDEPREVFGRKEVDPELDALEARITELAAHIHAATYRLLVLVAEFDRRLGWGHWGVRSCAHWLNWKCGLGMNAAREKVRTARSLEHLPRIAEAFRKGEVSYSKVRAMTRVATPENESVLLELARHGTATHVERTVRHYRRLRRSLEAEQAEESHAARYCRCYDADDGSLVVEARLPADAGALFMRALGAAADALYAREREESKTAEEAEKSQRLGFYLPRSPWDAVHGDKLAHEVPARERDTYSARRADALVLMAETLLAQGAATRPGGERQALVVHIDVDALRDDGAPGRCDIEDGPSVARETARRLGCDAALVGLLEDGEGTPLDVGRKTRSLPPAIQRALKARDGGCRFPGCTATRFVEGHHIEHWAKGGATRLDNLIQLCRFHHRLVHEGGYAVVAEGPSRFRFTRPDGRRIELAPEMDVTAVTSSACIEELNEAEGLDIDAGTGISLWDGTRIDYSMAVDALYQRDWLLGARDPPSD